MIPLKSPPQNPLSVLPSQHFTQRRHVGLSPLSGSSCRIFFPLLTVHLTGHSSTSAASFCFLSADLPLGDHLWMQTKNVAQAKVTHFSSRTFFFLLIFQLDLDQSLYFGKLVHALWKELHVKKEEPSHYGKLVHDTLCVCQTIHSNSTDVFGWIMWILISSSTVLDRTPACIFYMAHVRGCWIYY